MTRNIRFLPEVEDDVIRGYAWCEAKSSGHGEEYLRMFYACVSEISKNSLLYPAG